MTRPGGTARDVVALVARHPAWIGTTSLSPKDIEVTLAGQGESYTAWLARVVDHDVAPIVIRVARRAARHVAVSPEREFVGLHLAPPGLGPVPIHLGADLAGDLRADLAGDLRADLAGDLRADDAEPGHDAASRPAASFAYLVESFVPGRVLSGAHWDDVDLLAAHARTLARLHVRRWGAAGPVTSADANGDGISFVAEIDGTIAHWTPRVADSSFAADFVRLADQLRAYAARLEPDFADLDSFALLHGDPVMTNIVVTREPEGPPARPGAPGGSAWVTRLVDWEWTRIGDPARDLGLIGGAVHGQPWYAPLREDLIEGFLDAYLREAGALGTDLARLGSRGALRRRRDAWLATEAFAALAYVRWLGRDSPRGAMPRHTRTAAELTASLSAWFQGPG